MCGEYGKHREDQVRVYAEEEGKCQPGVVCMAGPSHAISLFDRLVH